MAVEKKDVSVDLKLPEDQKTQEQPQPSPTLLGNFLNLFKSRSLTEGIPQGVESGSAGMAQMLVELLDNAQQNARSQLPTNQGKTTDFTNNDFKVPDQPNSPPDITTDPRLAQLKTLLAGIQQQTGGYTQKHYPKDNFSSLAKKTLSGKPTDIQNFTDYTANKVAESVPYLAGTAAASMAGLGPEAIGALFGAASGASTERNDVQNHPNLDENQRAERKGFSTAIDGTASGMSARMTAGAASGASAIEAIPMVGQHISKAIQPLYSVLSKAMGSKHATAVMGRALANAMGQGSDQAAATFMHMTVDEHFKVEASTIQQKTTAAAEAFGINAIAGAIITDPFATIHALNQSREAVKATGNPGLYPPLEVLVKVQTAIGLYKNGVPGSQKPENQIHVVDGEVILCDSLCSDMLNNGQFNHGEQDSGAMGLLGQHIVQHAKNLMASQQGSASGGTGELPFKKNPDNAKTLRGIVRADGGLDPESLKAAGYNLNQDFHQSGMGNLLKKGGNKVDDYASELQGLGKLQVGANETPADALVRQLKANSKSDREYKNSDSKNEDAGFDYGANVGANRVSSQLSKRIEAKAKDLGLTDGFNELSDHEVMKMAATGEKADEFANNDYENAKKVAFGEQDAPSGVDDRMVFVAVAKKAFAEDDVSTLQKLAANTEMNNKISGAGTTLRIMRELEAPDVTAMKDINKVLEKRREPDRTAELKALQKNIEATQKAFDDYKAKMEKKLASKQPTYGARNKIVTRKDYAEISASLKSDLMSLHSGVDPTIMIKVTKAGIFHVEAGVREFGAWSEKMIEEYGDKIRPYLSGAWKNVQEKMKGADAENIKQKMSDHLAGGGEATDLGHQINQLAGEIIKGGTRGREAVLDELMKQLKDVLPDATRREIQDALSGYGKYKKLDMEETKSHLRDVKGQLQQVSKLEDMQKGQAPLKTGMERRTPSNEERALIKQVEEAKKKYGIETTDPATQLKSALASIKTRLKNQITDLENQINSGKKIVEGKTQIQYDAEANALKKTRDELKKHYDEVFHSPMTDAQRIKMATVAAEKSVAELERRIKEGDISSKAKNLSAWSPEISKLKQKQAELRDALDSMKEAANPSLTPEQRALGALKRRLQKSTQTLEGKLNVLDFEPKPKNTIPLDAEAQKLKAANELARKTYNTAKDIKKTITDAQAQKIHSLAKKMAEKQAAVPANSPKGSKARIEYGLADGEFNTYVSGLKTDAKALKASDFSLRGFKQNPFGVSAKVLASTGRATLDAFGISKALRATGDFSALLRQGANVVPNHPVIWTKNAAESFVDFYKTLGDKDYGRYIHADLASRPRAMSGEYKQQGLALNVHEEALPTSWPEKIPGVGRLFKGFENAYTGFIQRTRADVFDTTAEILEKTGKNNAEIVASKKGLGEYANVMTGRGNLGIAEPLAGAANQAFFSARLIKSDYDFLTSNLTTSMSKELKMRSAVNIVRYISAIAAIQVLHAKMGGTVEPDPDSSNFGKLGIGRRWINISGGKGAMVTLAYRMITAMVKTASGNTSEINTGKYGAQTRGDLVANFFQNRLSPAGSLVNDYFFRGKDFHGDKPRLLDEAGNMVTPFPLQNVFDYHNDPSADNLVASLADALGLSANDVNGKTSYDVAGNPLKMTRDQKILTDTLEHAKNTAKKGERIQADLHASQIKNAAIAVNNGKSLDEFTRGMDDSEANSFQKAVYNHLNRTSPDPLNRALANTTSNNQKVHVLRAAYDHFKNEGELITFLKKAVNNQLLSNDFAGDVLEDYRKSKK